LHSASGQATAYVEEAIQWLPTEQVKSETPESSVGEDAPGTAHRPRILWADDNADLRNYVLRLLQPYYDVVAVIDGSAALREAQRRAPDLVLSDVMMPGLDGFELLRALRSHPDTRTVPVILLSARAGEESSIEGLQAGADDYLVKPFSARELLARVDTHLKMTQIRRQWEGELAVANAELEAFSFAVSHDLRAPLRAIDGFTQMLAHDAAATIGARSKGYMDRILEGVEHMRTLIDALLELSRITRADVRKTPVDLSLLATQIVEGLRQGDPSRAISVTVGANLIGNGDRTLLQIVLTNLIGNAWKYSARAENAHMEFDRTPAGDGFYIRDNGAGFDMAFAERLFKPFQRLHSAGDFSGTGIGLATVHRVIVRHGGRIWAEAKPGRGATFFFTLPNS
jgi:signal transduction histidine kinase